MSAGVRVATPGDAPEVAALLHAFNTEFDTSAPAVGELAARLRALLAGDRLVAVLGGAGPDAVGVLTLRPAVWRTGQVALLEELYVRPELRGHGIGSAVLGRCGQVAREHDCAELQVNVDEVDTDARRFYERHGFRNREPGEDGVMFFYYRDI